MIKRFLIALVVIGVLVGGLAYFQLVFMPKMIKEFMSSQVPPPAMITAEAAKAEEWTERLPAIGTLIASQGVEVAAQVVRHCHRPWLRERPRCAAPAPSSCSSISPSSRPI